MTRQFGAREPGRAYAVRPSAYALACDDDGRVLCVRAPSGLHLPGGAIDPGEDGAAAVLRELKEETGYDARVLESLGRARQYEEPAIDKHAEFFRVALGAAGAPSESDHAPVWRTRAEAARELRHEFQRWAVSLLG